MIFVLLTVVFIFSNSLKTRDESKQDSDFFVRIIDPFVERLFGRKTEDLGFVVRKLAHITEFCLLGLGVAGLICKSDFKNKRELYGYGIFGVLSVAVIDEFIQSFSDRGSAVDDVLIDFCGAVIGFGIIFLISAVFSDKNARNR